MDFAQIGVWQELIQDKRDGFCHSFCQNIVFEANPIEILVWQPEVMDFVQSRGVAGAGPE